MNQIRRRRVPAMAAGDRRAALITATVPLLRERGLDVSTRQIAAAAGIAEGTIFGVFKDKNSLITAALVHALDPQPTLDAIGTIDPHAPLRERLTAAADLINDRFTRNARLMSAARTIVLTSGPHDESAALITRSRERLLDTLTEVIEPDAAALRHSPGTAARLLLLLSGTNAFGPFGDQMGFTGAEMVSLLLDGLLVLPAGDHERPLVIPAGDHEWPLVIPLLSQLTDGPDTC